LDGEEIAVESGTAVPDRSVALSGSASTSGIGTGIPGITPTTLITQLIQPAAGTLVYTLPGAADVTVNINAGEMEINSFIGSVQPTTALTTQAITSALQSFAAVSNTPTDSLLGQSVTTAMGSVTAQQDVEDTYISSNIGSVVFTMVTALTGVAAATGQGSVATSGDVALALTGEDFDSAIGDLTDSYEFALTGLEMLGEQTDDNFGLPLIIELSGAQALVEAGTVYLDNDRAFPLIGSSTAAVQGTLPVFVNAFVNGEFIATEQETIGPKTVELTGESVSVLAGHVTAPHEHGGRSKPKPPGRRIKFLIDDQEFCVESMEEGEYLCEQMRALAVEQAEQQAKAVVTGRKNVAEATKKPISAEPVVLDLPSVVAANKASQAYAAKLDKELTEIYQRATMEAEIALALARQRALDEEESLVLLLLD